MIYINMQYGGLSAFKISVILWKKWGTGWRSWLREYTASRKDVGSIPDGTIAIFIDLLLRATLWPLSRLSLKQN